MHLHLIVILSLLLISSQAYAVTAWVDDNGAASWVSCQGETPLSGTSACSLSTANSNVSAGDIVYLRSGTYSTSIAPGASGTDNDTRITYQNYTGEIAVISGIAPVFDLDGRSYITISGTNTNYGIQSTNVPTDGNDGYLNGDNMDYCIIEYVDIGGSTGSDPRFEGFRIGLASTYNWVHHSKIHGYAYEAAKENCYIGDDPYPSGYGDSTCHHNIIEDSEIYHGGHNTLGINGMYNIIRNNYLHNEEWDCPGAGTCGGRIGVVKRGTTNGVWNLIEGNRWAFTDMEDDPGLKFHSNDNIVRRNMFYATQNECVRLAALDPSVNPYVDDNYFIHNTFWYCGIDGAYADDGIWIKSSGIDGTVIKNNLFYQITESSIDDDSGGSTTTAGNFTDTADPKFTDAVYGNLDVDDPDYPDFTLQSDSPCIDNGVFLTTISSSTGSGTSFVVADAHYFVDDYDMPSYIGFVGDEIQLEGESSSVTITEINYSTNTITVDESISWTQGDGVALAFSGDVPDIGAYEYEGLNISAINDSTLSHGQTGVAITGTEFGTKSTAAPTRWEDWSDGVDGSILSSTSYWTVATDNPDPNKPQFSDDNLRHSHETLNARFYWPRTEYTSHDMAYKDDFSFPSRRVYLDLWTWHDFTSSSTVQHQIKMFKLCSETGDSGGEYPTFNHYEWQYSGGGHSCYATYSNNSGNVLTDYYTCTWNAASGTDSWHHWQLYLENSTVDGSDGSYYLYRDGTLLTSGTGYGFRESGDNPIIAVWLGTYLGNNDTMDPLIWYYSTTYIDGYWQHVEIGDASTYAACTHTEVQKITAWSDTEITFTANQGGLSNGTAYVYVIDENRNTSNGYPITLGSDTTPPTVSSSTINGTAAVLTCSEDVVIALLDDGDFKMTGTTTGEVSLNSCTEPSAGTISCTATSAFVNGETVTLAYSGGTDEVEDVAGNDMATFSGASVTNNTQPASSFYGTSRMGSAYGPGRQGCGLIPYVGVQVGEWDDSIGVWDDSIGVWN